MTTPQPGRRSWEDTLGRTTRNQIIADWLTFNLELDRAVGRAVSVDVAALAPPRRKPRRPIKMAHDARRPVPIEFTPDDLTDLAV